MTMCRYVPHRLGQCPAFMACAAALGAEFRDLGPGHGRYSVLMVWEDRA